MSKRGVHPAVDVRWDNNGLVRDPGANGYYWSSAARIDGWQSALGLGYPATHLNVWSSGSRSWGFGIRCVQYLKREKAKESLLSELRNFKIKIT